MEYILIIYEYLITRSLRAVLFQLALPLLLSWAAFVYFRENYLISAFNSDFQNLVITSTSILIGFSISVFTILLTSDNKHLKDSDTKKIEKKLYGKHLSLKNSLLIPMGYLIVVETVYLIINFIAYFTCPDCSSSLLFAAFGLGLICHFLLIHMSVVKDIFFIISKQDSTD